MLKFSNMHYVILVFFVLLTMYSVVPTIIVRGILNIQSKKRQLKNKNKKEIYLTFDDGPSLEYTKDLLNLLSSEGIRCTFFVSTSFLEIEIYQELLRELKNSNHKIGLHCSEHKNQLWLRKGATKHNYTQGTEIFVKGEKKYVRPPWGCLNIFSLYYIQKYKMKLIFWDKMAGDWTKDVTSKDIIRKLDLKSINQKVICLHDGSRGRNEAPRETIKALKYLIPKWKKEGYVFKTLF